MPMRERRAAHVRPLPPPGERMKPRRSIRADAPPPSALRRYRPISTAPQIPVPIGLAIASALIMLGIVTVLIGSGLVVDVARGVGSAFQNAITRLTSQPPPTIAPSGAVLDVPLIDPPANSGYTSQATQIIAGAVPPATVGKSGYKVHVYQLATNNAKTLVAEVVIGSTTRFSTPALTLTEGSNVFAAAIDGPTGEGKLSASVTYILDTTAPPITVSSPKQNALLNSSIASISGQTDPGVSLIIRNKQVAGGGVTTATAGSDGRFSASVAIIAGPNTIVITGTDEAGNAASTTITVRRSYGDLAAHLQVSPAKFAAKSSTTLTLTVRATSINGGPLADAQVTFIVQPQGLGPIQSPEGLTTNSSGTATWQIAISGATAGSGTASVMVTSPAGDVTMDTYTFTIT